MFKKIMIPFIVLAFSLSCFSKVSCPEDISDDEIALMILKRELHGEGLPGEIRKKLVRTDCLDDKKNFPHLSVSIETGGDYGDQKFEVYIVEDGSLKVQELSTDTLGVSSNITFTLSAKKRGSADDHTTISDSMQIMINPKEIRSENECGGVLDRPQRFYILQSCLKKNSKL